MSTTNNSISVNNNNDDNNGDNNEIITIERLQAMVKERADLEEELQTLMDYLTKGGGSLFGLNGSFVDREGYPSPHLDIIIEVKKARARIACIQTDYKILMKNIEDGMAKLHSQNKKVQPQPQQTTKPSSSQTSTISHPSASSSSTSSAPISPPKEEEAFVYIDLVTPGSPAAKSGLQQNDRIIQFGSIGPFERLEKTVQYLQSVAQVVRNSENIPINIRFIRNGITQSTNLTPRKWDGQGLLGCLMKPVPLD